MKFFVDLITESTGQKMHRPGKGKGERKKRKNRGHLSNFHIRVRRLLDGLLAFRQIVHYGCEYIIRLSGLLSRRRTVWLGPRGLTTELRVLGAKSS